MVYLEFSYVHHSMRDEDLRIFQDQAGKQITNIPPYLQRSHYRTLVTVMQYKPEPLALFAGSPQEAAEYLKSNNYEYLAGTNGQWVQPKLLTITNFFAKIVALYKRLTNGSDLDCSTTNRAITR